MRLSSKFPVPGDAALLYDFVNSIDLRRYVEQGAAHEPGDELETPAQLERWLRARGLLKPGVRISPAEHREAVELRAALRLFLASSQRQQSSAAACARARGGSFPFGDRCVSGAPARPAPDVAAPNQRARRRAGRARASVRQRETRTDEGMRFRRVPLDLLRPVQARQSPLVLIGSMRKPGEDPSVSRPSAAWRVIRDSAHGLFLTHADRLIEWRPMSATVCGRVWVAPRYVARPRRSMWVAALAPLSMSRLHQGFGGPSHDSSGGTVSQTGNHGQGGTLHRDGNALARNCLHDCYAQRLPLSANPQAVQRGGCCERTDESRSHALPR